MHVAHLEMHEMRACISGDVILNKLRKNIYDKDCIIVIAARFRTDSRIGPSSFTSIYV